MNICDNSIVLSIIMYFKYILIFLFLILIIMTIKIKTDFIKKILKILSIIIVIYIIFSLILFFTKTSYKSCVTNSNFVNIDKYKYLSYAYNNKTDDISSLDSLSETSTVGSRKIKVYNQNSYPINKYKFNLGDSNKEYSLKKSGNEILIFSSMLSGFDIGNDTNPVEIIRLLKAKDITNINMSTLLNSFVDDYNYYYKTIYKDEIYSVLNNNGLVIAKIHSNPDRLRDLTCSSQYFLIYGVDRVGNFKVVSSNDRDYDYVCEESTPGFGSVVIKNINSTSIFNIDIENNIDELYAVWR